jgi:hypothetical protein
MPRAERDAIKYEHRTPPPPSTKQVSISGSSITTDTSRSGGICRVAGAGGAAWSKDGGALRERYEYMAKEQGKSKKKAIAENSYCCYNFL